MADDNGDIIELTFGGMLGARPVTILRMRQEVVHDVLGLTRLSDLDLVAATDTPSPVWSLGGGRPPSR